MCWNYLTASRSQNTNCHARQRPAPDTAVIVQYAPAPMRMTGTNAETATACTTGNPRAVRQHGARSAERRLGLAASRLTPPPRRAVVLPAASCDMYVLRFHRAIGVLATSASVLRRCHSPKLEVPRDG